MEHTNYINSLELGLWVNNHITIQIKPNVVTGLFVLLPPFLPGFPPGAPVSPCFKIQYIQVRLAKSGGMSKVLWLRTDLRLRPSMLLLYIMTIIRSFPYLPF